MKNTHSILRTTLAPLVTLALVACASPGTDTNASDVGTPAATDMEIAEDQALFRIQNDSREHFSTIALRDLDGNDIPLGTVPTDAAENFIIRLPDRLESFRLVATGPEAVEAEEANRVMSDPFTLHGGATVTWFIIPNEVEIN